MPFPSSSRPYISIEGSLTSYGTTSDGEAYSFRFGFRNLSLIQISSRPSTLPTDDAYLSLTSSAKVKSRFFLDHSSENRGVVIANIF
jgi:hypothetical protein